MGTATAPVEGSGSCPSWMEMVEKPCLRFLFIGFTAIMKSRHPERRCEAPESKDPYCTSAFELRSPARPSDGPTHPMCSKRVHRSFVAALLRMTLQQMPAAGA